MQQMTNSNLKEKRYMVVNEKTKWYGLWNNREGVYSGQVIKKSDIPAYARIVLRYNKFYEKDSKRPRFVYCFANGDAANAITMEVSTDEYITLSEGVEMSEMRCFTDDQLQRLINRVACEVGGRSEYGEHIISDFVSGYGLETEVF